MTLMFTLVPVAAPEAAAIELVSLASGRYSVATLNEAGEPERFDQFDTLEAALMRVAGLVKPHVVYRSIAPVGVSRGQRS